MVSRALDSPHGMLLPFEWLALADMPMDYGLLCRVVSIGRGSEYWGGQM